MLHKFDKPLHAATARQMMKVDAKLAAAPDAVKRRHLAATLQ